MLTNEQVEQNKQRFISLLSSINFFIISTNLLQKKLYSKT